MLLQPGHPVRKLMLASAGELVSQPITGHGTGGSWAVVCVHLFAVRRTTGLHFEFDFLPTICTINLRYKKIPFGKLKAKLNQCCYTS